MAVPVVVTVDDGLAAVRLGREHGNAINMDLVEALLAACQRIEADKGVRGALLAASGKLFSPGLDLRELTELDRPEMQRFMRRFNECVLALYSFGKPLVAAIHGHAIAGGCVLALTADWRVLRRGGLIGLNELRIVPLPFGVTMILRESVNASRREEVALFGRNYTDEEAVATGLAHETHGPEGFEEHCRMRLGELVEKDARSFSTTKRYLRGPTIERIRAQGDGFLQEFLDAWFQPETRERIQVIVAGLKGRV